MKLSDNDREQIIRLWMDVFGDDRDFIISYLNRFATTDSYVVERNDCGNIIAMAHFPRIQVDDLGETAYLYALAVDKQYRNQGIATKLINSIFHLCKCPRIMTIPATPELRKWYSERFGFRLIGKDEQQPSFTRVAFDLGTGDADKDLFMVKSLNNQDNYERKR